MAKRTKLSDRLLPDYTRGEEIMNMVTHIVGGGLGVIVLLACLAKAIFMGNGYDLAGSIIYGVSMISLYTMSSVYHGLKPGMGKKVLQVLDHCTIYFLIAGTYSIIALCALREVSPVLGWGIFAFQWGMSALAVTLTAIDLDNYNVFSRTYGLCFNHTYIRRFYHCISRNNPCRNSLIFYYSNCLTHLKTTFLFLNYYILFIHICYSTTN